MVELRAAFRFFCYAGLCLSIVYSFVQVFLVLRFKRRHSKIEEPGSDMTSSSVIIPLSGTTRDSGSILSTLYHQTQLPDEVFYGLDTNADRALSMVQQFKPSFPSVRIGVVAGDNETASNRKIGKLAQLAEKCSGRIVVAIDQDIRMPSDHLKQVLSPFCDSRVGLVTSLYRINSPHSLGTALELLSVHTDFFPSVLMAEQIEGGLRFAFGATIAVRREVLQEIGGFGELADFLADDHELGARVHKAGYRVVLSGSLVEHSLGELTFKEYWTRQIRAARTHRICRPSGYALSLLVQGVPWIACLGVFGVDTVVLQLASLWMLARFSAAVSSHALLTEGKGPWWPFCLFPFHEILRFVFWLFAFGGNQVQWGNRRYQVMPGGRMRRVGKD